MNVEHLFVDILGYDSDMILIICFLYRVTTTFTGQQQE